MSQSTASLDAITGAGKSPAHFDLLDMTYRLRMRAFVGTCMPPIFASLEEHLKMMSFRKKGYAPIMFFLDFRSGATPIAFGRALDVRHELKLYRSVTDRDNRPAQEGTTRILFVSNSTIRAKARSHGPEALGYDDGSGAVVEAGSARIMHVITRPVAPPNERQVTSVPDELKVLKEHVWNEPVPSVESLNVPPEGYTRLAAGAWEERQDVWGYPNTDINQHVNVQEYVTGGENTFTRLLHGAGLPITKHRIARARLLFRKPFFPGQQYVIRAQLYRREQQTQMLAGFYQIENGQPAARANSFVVYDGEFES